MYNEIKHIQGTVHCDSLIIPVIIDKMIGTVKDNPDINRTTYRISDEFGEYERWGDPVTEEKETSVSIVYRNADQVILACDSRNVIPGQQIPNDHEKRYYVDRSRGIAAVFSGAVYYKDPKKGRISVIDFINEFAELTDGNVESDFALSSIKSSSNYIWDDTVINIYFTKTRRLISFINNNIYIPQNENTYQEPYIKINGSPLLNSWKISNDLTTNIAFDDSLDAENFIKKLFISAKNMHEVIKQKLDPKYISPIGGDIHIIRVDEFGRIWVDNDLCKN